MPLIHSTDTIGKVLEDPKTFAFTLLTIFLDIHGHDGLEWRPATIQMELEQEYGIDLPSSNFDRLMTAISIYTTNSFFVSTTDFARACVSLSGHHLTPQLMLLPDAEDVAWGITEGLLIHPPEEGEHGPFSHEITAFIGEILTKEGILNPPDVLRIATRDQSAMSRVGLDYGDDPGTLQDIMRLENEKTNSINKLIEGRLRGLLMQLSTLPLQNGQAMAMASKMLAKMPKGSWHSLPG